MRNLILLACLFLFYGCENTDADNSGQEGTMKEYQFEDIAYQIPADFIEIDTSYFLYFRGSQYDNDSSQNDLSGGALGPPHFKVFKAGEECYLITQITHFSIQHYQAYMNSAAYEKSYDEFIKDSTLDIRLKKFQKENNKILNIGEYSRDGLHYYYLDRINDTIKFSAQLKCLTRESLDKNKAFSKMLFP